jgi:hypothetical protein
MSGFSNFLTKFTSSQTESIMSKVDISSSSNFNFGYQNDGYVYLGNILIQFSADNLSSSTIINNADPYLSSFPFFFPISYTTDPYLVNVCGCVIGTGIENNSPIVALNGKWSTYGFSVRTTKTASFSWFSIGPAPSTQYNIFSNFLTNFSGGVNIDGSFNDLMSSAIIVPSFNTSYGHINDGFMFLSNMLIQFSATNFTSYPFQNNSLHIFKFPIDTSNNFIPYIVNVCAINTGNNTSIMDLVGNWNGTSFTIGVANSNNANATWVSISPAPTYPLYTNTGSITNAVSVAINGKGDKQYICDGLYNIYTNYNYGYGTWTNHSLDTSTKASKIVCSIDGTIVVVANTSVTNKGTYISTNSGSSFNKMNLNTYESTAVACNADGSYIYVSFYDAGAISANAGLFYYSTNKSDLNEVSLPFNTKPVDIATDSSGKYVYIVTIDNTIVKSNDYGLHWDTLNISLDYSDLTKKKITVNSTGQYSAVCTSNETNGYIFITLDYWNNYKVITTINKPWTSITSNSTGQYLCATNSNTSSGIYYSTDYGNNWINNTNYLSSYKSISMSSIGNIATAVTSSNVNVSFNAVN